MSRAETIDDATLVETFEACTLAPEDLDHRNHVRLAWLYLHRYPAPEVLVRLTRGLKAYTRVFGAEDKYHETVTWAWVLLIHERMRRLDQDAGWEEFARANPDLFARPSILKAYYREETLGSPLARQVFVLPDRLGAGEP